MVASAGLTLENKRDEWKRLMTKFLGAISEGTMA